MAGLRREHAGAEVDRRSRPWPRQAAESPFGFTPRQQDLNWSGIKFDSASFHAIMDIDREEARREAEDQKAGSTNSATGSPRNGKAPPEPPGARGKGAAVWKAPD